MDKWNLTDVYQLHGGCAVLNFHLWFYPGGMWKSTRWIVTSVLCFSKPQGNLQYVHSQRGNIIMNIFKYKTGLKNMSKGGNCILIVSLHKNNFSSNLNHKFAYFLFGSQIKLLAYTENSPSSVTSLTLYGCGMPFYIRVCTRGKILHWIWCCLDLHETVPIFIFFFLPKCKMFCNKGLGLNMPIH